VRCADDGCRWTGQPDPPGHRHGSGSRTRRSWPGPCGRRPRAARWTGQEAASRGPPARGSITR